MRRFIDLFALACLILAGTCLYLGATGQIDIAETIITTATSLYCFGMAAFLESEE